MENQNLKIKTTRDDDYIRISVKNPTGEPQKFEWSGNVFKEIYHIRMTVLGTLLPIKGGWISWLFNLIDRKTWEIFTRAASSTYCNQSVQYDQDIKIDHNDHNGGDYRIHPQNYISPYQEQQGVVDIAYMLKNFKELKFETIIEPYFQVNFILFSEKSKIKVARGVPLISVKEESKEN